MFIVWAQPPAGVDAVDVVILHVLGSTPNGDQCNGVAFVCSCTDVLFVVDSAFDDLHLQPQPCLATPLHSSDPRMFSHQVVLLQRQLGPVRFISIT